MKKVLLLLQKILLFVLCAILAINAWLLFSKLVLKEELPSLFGYSQVIVLSGSMEPVFSPGAMLVIHQEEAYEVGDVVTFKDQGTLVTHRIIGLDEQGFHTKGDANNAPDGITISDSHIYGKLQLVIPYVGQLLLFFKTPLGILLLIIAGVLLIEIPYLTERRAKEQNSD